MANSINFAKVPLGNKIVTSRWSIDISLNNSHMLLPKSHEYPSQNYNFTKCKIKFSFSKQSYQKNISSEK